MEQREKTGTGAKVPLPGQVYVCLNCGRRSNDRLGLHQLTPGWGASCTRAAVRFQVRDLQLNDRGFVEAIRKRAVLTYASKIWN